jgi:hypothetical protein
LTDSPPIGGTATAEPDLQGRVHAGFFREFPRITLGYFLTEVVRESPRPDT